jgi:hypothetical protein
MIKEGTRRLSDIVTGDELWFYQRHIAKRESNKTWVYEGEKPKTVVRQSRFEPKTTFSVFLKEVVWCIYVFWKGESQLITVYISRIV